MAQLRGDGDTLVQNLKSLQKENASLQQKLTDVRNQRVGAENALDNARTRFIRAKDSYAKLLEGVKVGQHKVTVTEVQVKHNDEIRATKNAEIEQLKRKIEEERDKQQGLTAEFEDNLTRIANGIKDMHRLYGSKNQVESQIAEIQKSTENSAVRRNDIAQDCDGTSRQLAELQIDAGDHLDQAMFTAHEQESIYDILKEDEEQLVKLRRSRIREAEEVEAELQSMQN